MSRGVVLKGLLVLFVLLGASLSTARARQVSAENQAHVRLIAAERATDGALRSAAAAGLLAPELAPFQSRAEALARAPAPSSLPILSSSLSRFYDHQARAYRALRLQVRGAVGRVTLETRSQARAALRRMERSIAQAERLDLDARDAQKRLAEDLTAFRSGALPRDFRPIPGALEGPRARLDQRVQREMRDVASVLMAAHGERTQVVDRAFAEATTARYPLSLLQLLTPRAEGYRLGIGRMLARVREAHIALLAAVRELQLQAELARLFRDYARTVPDKMIVVSTEAQSATLYQDKRSIYRTPVTTGGPELPTDHGVFHIYLKLTPFTFHSPWPPSSPYYYPPTPIQFWMPFDGGEGLHDASWRTNFGPGSNFAPTDLGTGNTILGTHGCVNLPFSAAQFVWDWAPVGTTVVVI